MWAASFLVMIVTVTRGTEESYRAPGFRRTRAASRRGKRLVPGSARATRTWRPDVTRVLPRPRSRRADLLLVSAREGCGGQRGLRTMRVVRFSRPADCCHRSALRRVEPRFAGGPSSRPGAGQAGESLETPWSTSDWPGLNTRPQVESERTAGRSEDRPLRFGEAGLTASAKATASLAEAERRRKTRGHAQCHVSWLARRRR